MTYDAFLSYNTKDRAAVEAIALYLKDKAGLKVFFDRWEMIPGTPVQEALEKALAVSAACVVFIGPNGLSNYQVEEMRIALEKSIVKKDLRVIPVLLPGGKRETKESELPPFLRRLSWEEFGDDPMNPEVLRRLECGIKNLSPGPGAKPLDQPTGICPYRGLEVFREQDRAFFFGRDTLVQRLMARLKSERFLALIGPSGSGKSSVLQAGLIPMLRSDSLVALLTPRERPLEELALALRRAAASNQLPYSTAQMVDQFNHSSDSLHYLAREILQALPVNGTIPVQRFVVIVDQWEEIFTLTQLEADRRQFISLLLRAVEMVGGPVTVILAIRSDFIGKCAPYRDLNIYFSEHLEQVEPMTREELQSAFEKPAQAVGLEFEPGLVGVMLEDVKGTGSELPLIGHALLELYNYQPRPGNRLTAQAYAAIGRIEGALVRRAETLYNGLTVPQQETLRKMFLLGLIQPGEGVPDTRRRASKEELLAIGGDAGAAEKLIYELATARLLTVGRNEAAGQETVEVAHEALIRKWGRIGEWMAEGREMARQRGLLRQAAREWEKSGKNPEYLIHGSRLVQMEEFVIAHGQDLGALENEFITAGTAEREAQRRKKRRNLRAIIGALMVVLLVVTYFAYRADRNEKKAIRQLVVNYWDNARKMRENNDRLKALHLFCEALTIEKDKRFREVLLADMNELWKIVPLLNIFQHKDRINGARFNKDETHILTWSSDGTARLWDSVTGKPIGEVMKHEDGVNGAIFNKDETHILTWSGEILKETGTARLWEASTGKAIGEIMKHKDYLNGAIFNQNGTRILTWSNDKTARLWDAATGKPIGKVMNHESWVTGVTFSKDETFILTWRGELNENGTAHLWDATGKPIGAVMKHESRVNGAIFNKEGTRILTWNGDCFKRNGTARLWDTATGKPIGAVMKHDNEVFGAIFNQNETRILTWSLDGTARLWDAATGKSIGKIMKHKDQVNAAIFNKDGTRILTWSSDCTAQLWDAATGKPIGKLMKHESGVDGALFNKDETHILTWSWDGTARLWDATTGEPIGEIMTHDGIINSAVFNQNETCILTRSDDSTARLWDAATGKPISAAMKHENSVRGAVFNRDNTHILTWSDDSTARLWDVTSKLSGEVVKHEKEINGAIINKDGTHILTWSDDGTARLWDVATDKPSGEVMKHEDVIKGAIFNKDDTCILTWSADCTVRIWDATGKPFGELIKHEDLVNGAIFNNDETRILTWSDDGTARLWDAATGKPIGVVMKHESGVNGAIFNHDGTRILTWSADGTARLWDTSTGKSIGKVMKHENNIEGTSLNKSGTRIVTWSWDGTVRLWDVAGKPIGAVMKHEGIVNGVIFNQDATRILTWSGEKIKNGRARLWDASDGKPIGELMKHEDEVNGAIFNKDETRILTWSSDGTARLWDADTGKPINESMRHYYPVLGAIFNKDETRILTWSYDGTARMWDANTGKPIGEVMQHESMVEVEGAVINENETRILTWSADGLIRIWDIAIDPDFPMEYIKLQAQAITGTSYDTITNTVNVIPPEEWREIKKKYMEIAARHYQSCRYPEGNVFRKLFPVEAQKVRPENK